MESEEQQLQHRSSAPTGLVPTESPIVHDGEINANAEDETGAAEGDDELVAEEVEVTRALPNPVLPNQAQVDHHWLSHLPYRSWCGACVGGRGRAIPHWRTGGRRKIPTLAFDYCFISKTGVYSREEWVTLKANATTELEGVKILVVREIVSRCTFAHVVQHKGVDDDGYAVSCLVKDIEWLGATKLMLRSDNEPAIIALLKKTLKTVRIEVADVDQIAEEHPPERDPQANGAIESAVGGFKGLLRTYVVALETRLGHRVPPDHPVISWLVQHTSYLMTVKVKGEDGQTAYERVRMRAFNTRMLEFAEMCRYKLDPK